jgi:DNA adenine methylase
MVINTITDPVERAAMYFIINRCSFSGATLSGGFSSESSTKRFTDSSIDTLSALDLSDYNITNYDFTESIAKTSTDHVIFADPPYYLEKRSKLYGNNGDLHEEFDHDGFFRAITSFSGNWIVTYNDHPKIRELYADYEILPADWAYGMNKSKKSSEIIITSRKKEQL